MKTVLIDGYNLGLEKGTGVATYARNLSREIGQLGHKVSVLYGNRSSSSRDPLLREITFFDSTPDRRKGVLKWLNVAHHALRGPLGRSAVDVPMTGRVISRSFAARMPHHDRILNSPDLFRRSQDSFRLWGKLGEVRLPDTPDLVHWTYPIPLRVRRCPNIYTLHDIVPLRLPYTTLDDKRSYLKLMRRLDASADHIVTVSENSRRDLIEIAGISSERVTNTYQSVSIPASLREKAEEQVAREIEGFAGTAYKGYFLFFGSIEPKKNVGRIIEAYLASTTNAPLVILGAQAWKSTAELQLLDALSTRAVSVSRHDGTARKQIIHLPYAPFGLLVSMIRGARAVLFPSLYEGFGLPVLEAMLLGTPVICSDTSSLPEVAGDAALMVDPYDAAAISAAIRQIDEDADLREELGRRGLAQAARFSPEAHRDRLHAVYQRLL
ncbi:glycosyltransferase family 1 protein [Altererythrobacter fulvus]|uniref:glycosyltransferase family 4 protein n=1 Tax=Caenibius fulvus TaxID=2126012 RepID=UPI00301A7315